MSHFSWERIAIGQYENIFISNSDIDLFSCLRKTFYMIEILNILHKLYIYISGLE